MSTGRELPTHLAERAASIKAKLSAQLPAHTILYRNISHPLDSTTLIPYSALLKPHQLEILNHDAVSLVEALGERKYTAVDVVEAYAISASIAHQATNCLTWYDYPGALGRAKELDKELEETGRLVGPLHGVVISIKQLVQVKGWPQNASHFNFEEFIPEEDALLVKILREAGAVFMVKTTQPQSIMQLETQSWNYGRTSCAYNRNCTSGGSSGGEGALVAMKGSVIGVGTDIGGSLRNPAAFNGLWGFKSSSKRLPRDGVLGGLWGGTHHARIRGCIGPLTRSLRDMELFMKVIMASESWRDDVSLLPIPWRTVSPDGEGLGYKSWSGEGDKKGNGNGKGRLRVGVMSDDGWVRPVGCIQRAMAYVVGKLEEAGMEVVNVEPREFRRSWDVITALYYIDGGKKLREILDDEPLLPLTEWIVNHSKSLSSIEIDTLISQREGLRQEYLTYFRSLNLDVLLLPAGPAPAQLHNTTRYWSYTSMFNILDWPAAVFPTGLVVDPKLDCGDEDQDKQGMNEDEKHLYETFSAETSVGVPIGLQLVAPRFEDERLMEALKHVERAIA